MGHTTTTKCLNCGNKFFVDHGGGFTFHLLRCDKCGKAKSIGFDKLGDLHVRYVKGLPGPYCIASAQHDRAIQKNASVKPISEKEYHKGAEVKAGKCRCGGRYRFDAPPRCPKCRSTKLEEGEDTIFFD